MSRKAQAIGVGIIAVAIVAVAWCLRSAEATFIAGEDSKKEIGAVSDQFAQNLYYLPDDEYLGFVEIPAGLFTMGSDPNIDSMAYENERWSLTQKQGVVDVPRFYIGRFEVTTAQFKTFVNETDRTVNVSLLPQNPLSPIVNITWADALAYCRWLQQKLKTNNAIPPVIENLLSQGWIITLPTEAQWEKAARGENGQLFPWGNEITTDFANFSAKGIKPVGSMLCKQCAYGLADMSGNVWELTRSPYLPYPFSNDAAVDLTSDALFVMRGGSFSDSIGNVRAAIRGGIDPGVRNNAIGFRIVLTQQ